MAKEKKAKQPRPMKKKPQKKGMRGKMPVKRSINLMVIDENRIKPLQAIPAVILILLLAGVFSKFLVYDRIVEVSSASGRVSQLKTNLAEAQRMVENYGDVEDTYAHYTIEAMTIDELSLVDRTRVLALVRTLLSEGNATFGSSDFRERFDDSLDVTHTVDDEDFDPFVMRETLREFAASRRDDTTVYTWSVTGNTLTVDITGGTLEKLNKVARRLETSPIVDSCTISTANKQGNLKNNQDVTARLIIYLMQPTEEASAS